MLLLESIFVFIIRYAIVFLMLYICWSLWRCILEQKSIGSNLILAKNNDNPIMCNKRKDFLIGRFSHADIKVSDQTVSRRFAIIRRNNNSSYLLERIGEGCLKINDQIVNAGEKLLLKDGDKLTINDKIFDVTIERIETQESTSQVRLLVCISLLQLLLLLQILVAADQVAPSLIIISFSIIFAIEWLYWLGVKKFKLKSNIIPELIAFLISSISLVVACENSSTIIKSAIFFGIGFLGFLVFSLLCNMLEKLENDKIIQLQKAFCLLICLIFIFNIIFAGVTNGAKNWINIAGISVQPSEICKVLFIIVCSTPLDFINTRKGTLHMLMISIFVSIAMIFINDLGAMAVFLSMAFLAFWMKEGNILSFALVCSITAVMTKILAKISANFSNRISVWGKALLDPTGYGYQQSKALAGIAAGGLFGVGILSGSLRDIAASHTDLVFTLVSEEMGFLFLLSVIVLYILLAISIYRNGEHKSYYGLTASVLAITYFLVQVILNLGGSTNILPFTGITAPFLSLGGSSMVASWCILAFGVEGFKNLKWVA